MKDIVRVIIPDSHGSEIDPVARDAFLADLPRVDPDEIVMLGDHVDVGGLYSNHGKAAAEEAEYSYAEDLAEAASFLDSIQKAAPKAKIQYIEGNHEYRIERWAIESMAHGKDVAHFIRNNGPEGQLELKRRGIAYYRRMVTYQGLSIPNTIKLGKCYFTHGIGHSMHAASAHVVKFGANIVFGHTHRAQEFKIRTVKAGVIGGWNPGTLAKLQPYYMHTRPTDWSHGYGVQFVNGKTGSFLHVNVAIAEGVSMLLPLANRLKSALDASDAKSLKTLRKAG